MTTIFSPDSHPERGAKRKDDNQRGSKQSTTKFSTPSTQSRSISVDRREQRTKRKMDHNQGENCEETKREDNEDDPQGLFFVDLQPAILPSTNQEGQFTASDANEEQLLLPSHVTVLGSIPVDILEFSLPDYKEDNFIKYLDYEDAKVCLLYRACFTSVIFEGRGSVLPRCLG